MAKLNVNPTRMELTRLKGRLKTAKRGHKLLKDKQDELMKKFIDYVKRNMELRLDVEKELTVAFKNFLIARAVMSSEVLEEAIMYPTQKINLEMSTKNIMSVNSPVFNLVKEDNKETSSIYPYGFATTSGELDGAIYSLQVVFDKLIELAQVEKTCQLMADEIEKTRRRVNALEYVMIPQLIETVKYITMKLDENERGSRVRLMKVKDMMEKQKAEA
ncbi:MAG TPA: V-type ATP synthase subunit D [Bacillota bacterium]|nr:V-type ATP synthase subunit D [Bacillota bacterium]HQE67265.1 V-type ATP synthase subunit D [Bacillota bacterium]HQI16929.1 V-type ATP synthase subunit D [Bacillota bacterium]HQJ38270.1 V-type ATP synthase subunit D [Bacillota bacterium]HRU40944.1 V-type ATP synthase subunit D [Candidatus Diapherotrites archaeon]